VGARLTASKRPGDPSARAIARARRRRDPPGVRCDPHRRLRRPARYAGAIRPARDWPAP